MCHTYYFTFPCGHKLSLSTQPCVQFALPIGQHPKDAASHVVSRFNLGEPDMDCNICIALQSQSLALTPTPSLDHIHNPATFEPPSSHLPVLLAQRRQYVREAAQHATSARMESTGDVESSHEAQMRAIWPPGPPARRPAGVEQKIREHDATEQLWDAALARSGERDDRNKTPTPATARRALPASQSLSAPPAYRALASVPSTPTGCAPYTPTHAPAFAFALHALPPRPQMGYYPQQVYQQPFMPLHHSSYQIPQQLAGLPLLPAGFVHWAGTPPARRSGPYMPWVGRR
ncbi:hypothetical protein MMC13_001407 [Lambiella insularis]|nr:hypothetical protein [Lambiella insularis]